MNLDDFIISCFVMVDEALEELLDQPLRQRGPAPVLHDSEVITMEIAGEFLGMSRDTEIFSYFRNHWSHFFPGTASIHRTTFVRQAANLWKVKDLLWQRILSQGSHLRGYALVDSFPVHACQFARAYRCQRFRGDAGFGKDSVIRQTFYGFRIHARVCWPGLITQISITPANTFEQHVVPELTEYSVGTLLGDRNYWSPRLTEELGSRGIRLIAPFRHRKTDPHPERWTPALTRLRYRIDTVFGQLVDRYDIKRVWAKDMWHFVSRVLRKTLSHTVAVSIASQLGKSPLRLAEILHA